MTDTARPVHGGKWLRALVLGATACASAQAEPIEWSASAAVVHRTLTESSADGARLLKETGYLPRVQLSAHKTMRDAAALAAEASYTQGRLDYDGRTQTAQAVSTSTGHREAELSLHWRPLAPAAWGEAWLGLGWLHARRHIEPTAVAGGLKEVSSVVVPGVRWRSPAWILPWGDGSTKLQAEAQVRTSARHALSVDYLGLYDASDIDGGRRNELSVHLMVFQDDYWRWSFGWTRTQQKASNPAVLYRAGFPVGTVHQPRLRIDDLSLSLSLRF